MTEPDKTAAALDSVLDTNAIEKVDVTVAVAAGQFSDNPAVQVLGAASEVADQPPMFAISAATLAAGLALGRPRLAATGGRMLAAVALATAAKAAIKMTVSRTRPNKAMEDGRYEARMFGPNEGPWNSFPSGHTANAVAVGCTIARTYPEARAPAYAAAAAAALIQVPRGAHYPVDVAAGALIGWASEAAVDAAARRMGLDS